MFVASPLFFGHGLEWPSLPSRVAYSKNELLFLKPDAPPLLTAADAVDPR